MSIESATSAGASHARTPLSPAKAASRLSRLWRWEFWPRRVFYLPMVPIGLLLALRYRSLTLFTASNPGIAHGGVVGESKFELLRQISPHAALKQALLPAGPQQSRAAQLDAIVESLCLDYPFIIKPDVGERGCGVRLATSKASALAVLAEQPGPLVIQEYHPGPIEVGIAYIRHPAETCGRILSITTKVPPTVIGDGHSTIQELIDRDERLILQRAVFAKRLADRHQMIPSPGERVPLGVAGNHCQGTMFLDGSALMTPALELAIDAIAKSIGGGSGFYIGRLDARCTSTVDLRDGRNIKVMEINGVLGESTNIYDPSFSLLKAYSVLTRQWAAAFAIGAENVRQGRAKATPLWGLIKLIREHQRRPGSGLISD